MPNASYTHKIETDYQPDYRQSFYTCRFWATSASDRKRKKNKIKQLYNTTQRNEKHRQTFVHI